MAAPASDPLYTEPVAEEAVIENPGGPRLFRYTIRPAGDVRADLLVLHGYGDHGGRYVQAYRWLAGRGVACHALDFRGHGRADGRRGYVARWDEYLDDLSAFLSHAPVSAGAPLFVLGHSHGSLVLGAAALRPQTWNVLGRSPAGLILASPFFRSGLTVPRAKIWLARVADRVLPSVRLPSGLRDEWMSSDPEMIADSRTDPHVLRIATPRWFLTMQAMQRQVLERAPEIRLPLLLLMGEDDRVADRQAARQFLQRAGSADKTSHWYPRYRHELLREAGRETVWEEILAWLRAHIS